MKKKKQKDGLIMFERKVRELSSELPKLARQRSKTIPKRIVKLQKFMDNLEPKSVKPARRSHSAGGSAPTCLSRSRLKHIIGHMGVFKRYCSKRVAKVIDKNSKITDDMTKEQLLENLKRIKRAVGRRKVAGI